MPQNSSDLHRQPIMQPCSMIDTLYIEDAVREHPRTQTILERFPRARQIPCERYSQVFNPKAQNFRVQKQKPALILAEKFKNFVLPAPPGYGIGAQHNYYFSHMLNCLYDCRYCFLQGMYRSAHYVLFVNYEDFVTEIGNIIQRTPNEIVHFFSGYDCDSLAMEPVSQFVNVFIPVFRELPNACIEFRTKSTQIRNLLKVEPIPNVIIAYSFTPETISRSLEHKVPSMDRRLAAMQRLQQQGWQVGLRFDPLIYQSNYQSQYRQLFETVFKHINPELLHSVSLGSFRLPNGFFRALQKLYPQEKLFAGPLDSSAGMTGYRTDLEQEMMQFCTEALSSFIPDNKLFPCTV